MFRYFISSLAFGLCLSSFAATIYVPADYPTIGQAINAAAEGDEIIVSPGEYPGFNTGKRVTVRSTFDGRDWSTVENTIVKKNTEGSIVGVAAGTDGLVIRGFRFTRDPMPNPPAGYNGRGITADWTTNVTIEYCIIENCVHTPDPFPLGDQGSGAAIVGINGVIQNNIIRNNRAAGGAAIEGGNGIVRNNIIHNNTPSSIVGTVGRIVNNTIYDSC
jgi:hypothetical protein